MDKAKATTMARNTSEVGTLIQTASNTWATTMVNTMDNAKATTMANPPHDL